MATLGAFAATALAFVALGGVRADIGHALEGWRFYAKVGVVAAVMSAALTDCARLMRPTEQQPVTWSTLLVVLALVVAVAVELAVSPVAEWGARLVGSNGLKCLVLVPLLAFVPFLALMWAMQRGAPASPTWAGATVGRAAAAMGAVLYAFHCFDDSPLFVAAWYSAAVVGVSGFGAVIGARLLKW